MLLIRSAARALIVRDGRVLLTRCVYEGSEFYLLPGGGQNPGESLRQTVARECREEIDTEVEVGALRFVRDYIPSETGFSYLSEAPHQVEHIFECQVPEGYRPGGGVEPDSTQVGVEWVEIDRVPGIRVYPGWLMTALQAEDPDSLPVYQGDAE